MITRSPDKKVKRRVARQLPWLLVVISIPVLMLIALFPLLDGWLVAGQAEQLTKSARARLDLAGPKGIDSAGRGSCHAPDWLLRLHRPEPILASWGNVGGCGVSGATGSAGGFKWVGRGVTGGLVDIQCIASQNVYLDGTTQLSFSTRLGTNLGYKWSLAATVPFMYTAEKVDSFGEELEAHLPGFGDVSLELTRKLGITNAHTLTLSLTAPSGAHDSVRKGVILPQRMQLGSGVMGASLTYEYTLDFDWGPMIFGGTLGYGGWENSVGDFRAPSASAYVHLGYLLGPLVPSAGLNITGRFMSDRERYLNVNSVRERFTVSPTVGLEWSSDYLAIMLSFSAPCSFQRMDNWSVGIGLQTSLF
ncbi:MAG: hypothetical protein JRJ19_02005 [Deltaproteobacteria bacterium]|nr:hypothetical protein [Deltaproteobacteria bacterium]